ncbi:hypothetical protein QBC40DRAFT_289669 [Triangularia verruculosa]|uniref:Mannosyl-3-phosphoglycerate synthase n=1 Tax=Triangularia verruculosa TaxID=2587418 RepID=A0AAN6X6K8_9PEZI|nr:hypothetical protein QBC40DRAFT_289669 [Triangularia verruculosa]
MRYTLPLGSRSFGPLCIMHQAKVVELEPRPTNSDAALVDQDYDAPELSASGRTSSPQRRPKPRGDPSQDSASTVTVFPKQLNSILAETVIVVPCKDEEVEVIKGVVAGIPGGCAVILVSNCSRQYGENGWEAQARMLSEFIDWGREGCFVHQKYCAAARAFKEAGVPEILDPETGRIRNGKGEGMYLGIALARSYFPKHQYIGFIDADNRIPGSVTEYCKAYAGGFASAPLFAAESGSTPEDVMVRICWASKPKHNSKTGRIEFMEQGRSSRIVNTFLNKLFVVEGEDREFITTGNAGEHAMTMEMALRMQMANGYAIEPFQFIEPLLRHSSSSRRDAVDSFESKPNDSRTTHVLQIKTANPHLHRETNNDHITKMWAAGLGALYHHLPSITTAAGLGTKTVADLRKAMHRFALENGAIEDTEELPCARIYPPLDCADLDLFRYYLGEPCLSYDGSKGLWFYGLVEERAWFNDGSDSPTDQSISGSENESSYSDDRRSFASSEEEVLSDFSKSGE